MNTAPPAKKGKEGTQGEDTQSKRRRKKPVTPLKDGQKSPCDMSTRSKKGKKKNLKKPIAGQPGLELVSNGPTAKPSSVNNAEKLPLNHKAADMAGFSEHKKKRLLETEKPNDHQKATFNEWIGKYMSVGVGGLMDEYDKKIKGQLPRCLNESNRAVFSANESKNRYSDVVCLEPTRVILKDGRPGDYIHANYIRGEPLLNNFIATQAPMPGTVIEFWRMVVQEKVRHIFMLCEIFEQGKQKCERYFPENAGEKLTFGDFALTNTERGTPEAHIVLCKINVEYEGKSFVVEHHNMITWPDKSAPKSLLAVFRLLKFSRSSRYETSVVHCSAGIGRTGTFIILEYVLQNILANAKLDLAQCVLDIREMRMSSVQIDIQYVYIVAAIGKFASSMGCLTPETEQRFKVFIAGYEDYLTKRQAAEAKCCLHGGGGGGAKTTETPKGFEISGGQNMTTIAVGTNLSAFPMPEGAGTDFKMDAFETKPAPVTVSAQPPISTIATPTITTSVNPAAGPATVIPPPGAPTVAHPVTSNTTSAEPTTTHGPLPTKDARNLASAYF